METDLSPMQSRDEIPTTVSRIFQPTGLEAEVLPHKAYVSTKGSRSHLSHSISGPQSLLA